ncbi:MAG: TfoX/Sxy family protein [Chitinophagaceae bacterium]|nr:TfoX/Sxy family protein [Chitinophagaceae bacterium]
MAYNTGLAERIRAYLAAVPELQVEEKKMFSGLAFLVNGKMCVNVTGEQLMCRFDPAIQASLQKRKAYQPMIMKGRVMNGYCCVAPDGFKTKKDFEFWIKLCLGFNDKAKSSKKKH